MSVHEHIKMVVKHFGINGGRRCTRERLVVWGDQSHGLRTYLYMTRNAQTLFAFDTWVSIIALGSCKRSWMDPPIQGD